MKRFSPVLVVVMVAGAAFAESAGGYRVEVIGGGPLMFCQPRCLRAGLAGRVYLLEGEREWTRGSILGDDGVTVKRFGADGRTDGKSGLWYHPASLRVTASGDVLVADTGNRRVLLFSAEGEFKNVVVAPGAGDASLEGPTDALELASGELVVCDSASSRVLLYDRAGKLKRVVASPGSRPDQVNHPFSLALDPAGNLWIADTLNRRLIQRGTDMSVKRVLRPMDVDGGSPLLRWVSYLDFDRSGNLLVADDGLGCILKLSPEGKLLGRIGQAEGKPRPFSRLSGVAVAPDGTILASDAGRNCIFRFDPQGEFLGRTGTASHGERMDRLAAVLVAADGSLFKVFQRTMSLIQHYGADGVLKEEFGGEGTAPGKFLRPRGAALGPDGNLYVADSENQNITVLRPDGVLVRVFGKPGKGAGDMYYPRALAVSDEGIVYVGDAGNQRVQLYQPTGECVRTLSTIRVNPYTLDVDAKGNCAVYDDADRVVVVFDGEGRERWRISPAEVRDVGATAFAPDGKLWVLDRGEGAVQVFGPDGTPQGVFRDERFKWAECIMRGRDGKMHAGYDFGVCTIGSSGEMGLLVPMKVVATPGQTPEPSSLALVWDDELAVLSSSGTIQLFGRDGKFRRVLKTTPAINSPSSVGSGPGGDLFVLDSFGGELYRVKPSGAAEIAGSGELFRGAGAFAVGADGRIYLLQYARQGIVRLDAAGKEAGLIQASMAREQAPLRWPRTFTVIPGGDVLVIDWHHGNVVCYGPDLGFQWMLDREKPGERGSRRGVAAVRTDREGNFYLLAGGGEGIQKLDRERKYLATIRPDRAEPGAFARGEDMVIDGEGNLFVADSAGNRVLKFVPQR